ncbi:hypothetical protein [Cognatishimia activa]|uniref:Uncharacterized protein n=1 Tax=Cognatishimia activa TaxID=1715691 RepID=A0A975I7E4_9RHOB|nr:hypothetical protein [Cognatishimia activa]QTN36088.1 hypothetical protein HZ995_00735 [Cognatishimia activa]
MKQISVRFHVPEHHVSVDTFVASALSTQRIIDTLNDELFGGDIVVVLVVAAPESGSIRQILKVVVKGAKISAIGVGGSWAVFWSIVQMLETDIAKSVIKELTGQEPAAIAADVVREYHDKAELQKSKKEIEELEAEAIEKLCEKVEEIFVDSAASVLEAPRDQLDSLGISLKARYELTSAQAELFEKCISEMDVSAIEFENTGSPPIPRSGFPERAIRPQKPEKDESPNEHWDVSIVELTVTSPVLEKRDQETRKWKGRIGDQKSVLFAVEDQDFWNKVDRHDLSFGQDDKITVQLATKYVDGRQREHKAVRVLKFNDQSIGRALDENALASILGEYIQDSDYLKNSPRGLFDRL